MAKPEAPSGTIALPPGVTPALGASITFLYTVAGKLPGNTNARIQVLAYQEGKIVYGAAGDADPALHPGDGAQPFVLGGASSDWLQNGGPAECVAQLYYWDNHPVQVYVPLSDPLPFHAEG